MVCTDALLQIGVLHFSVMQRWWGITNGGSIWKKKTRKIRFMFLN